MGVVVNSLFSVYDKILDDAVGRLFRAWTTVLNHDGRYRELRSGVAHVFFNPGDAPLPPEREAVWNEIDAARREMRLALDIILNRLRNAYIDINIHKANKKAFNDYRAYQREIGELDSPTSRKASKRTAKKTRPVRL